LAGDPLIFEVLLGKKQLPPPLRGRQGRLGGWWWVVVVVVVGGGWWWVVVVVVVGGWVVAG